MSILYCITVRLDIFVQTFHYFFNAVRNCIENIISRSFEELDQNVEFGFVECKRDIEE